MVRYIIITNQMNKSKRALIKVKECLSRNNITFDIINLTIDEFFSLKSNYYKDFCQKIEDLKICINTDLKVMICGGDGTVNAVINCLTKCQSIDNNRLIIQILPTGTVNEVARTLGYHKLNDIEKIIYFFIEGNEFLTYNAKSYGNGVFLVGFASGRFTNATYLKPKILKKIFKKFAYFFVAFLRIFSKPIKLSIRFNNGEIVEYKNILVAFSMKTKTLAHFKIPKLEKNKLLLIKSKFLLNNLRFLLFLFRKGKPFKNDYIIDLDSIKEISFNSNVNIDGDKYPTSIIELDIKEDHCIKFIKVKKEDKDEKNKKDLNGVLESARR